MAKKKVEEIYQKLTQREHVLKRPDTYIGSIEPLKDTIYTSNELEDFKNVKIVKKELTYTPGFVKIFDEILTNASDHKLRDDSVSFIKVILEDNKISVENNGSGIPIKKGTYKLEGGVKEEIYVPELIFGHLLSGSNYDDNEERYGGGRNGYGAKLTNIFSTKFIVHTDDGKNNYRQVFKNNMNAKDKSEPDIKKSTGKEFTKITFYPDFSKFNMKEIDDETKSLLIKRVIDIAAYNPTVRVSLNGTTIPIKSFKDYIDMHLEEKDFFYEKLNDYWEIGIAPSSGQFEQVSLVNGIATHKGGTHANYFALKIAQSLHDKLKKDQQSKVKWYKIKDNLSLFISGKIANPVFDTQTKETLANKMDASALKDADVSQNTINKIFKSDVISNVLEYAQFKEQQELKKLTKKLSKQSKITIDKLSDANFAGGKKSNDCYIALTEGDSAKTFAISGMSEVGRDYWGAFPLKGKSLNVRDTSLTKVRNNQEIQNIISILGLEYGKQYTSTDDLRYGKCVIMTDSDNDGTHIKGLLLNFFHVFFPELLKLDFFYEFITPIVKVTPKKKGASPISFYKNADYKKWVDNNDTSKFSIKYYKGLGTSTAKEAKEYFKNIDKHLIPFKWDTDKNDDYIDLLFNSKRSDERKDWILKSDIKDIEKYGKPTDISSFINNEFIEFSIADNIRSIPNLYDGLKPSQRKIMFTVFKRNITSDIKVATLSGSVQETSAYHHGLNSLDQSIINLAQNYINSNNVNLLEPSGQFGTRLLGGKDASSSRYTFTRLRDITRNIFRKEDENILNWLTDDGQPIEPEYYMPTIPLVLINGAEGIGTGWSTFVAKFNIKDVIKNIELHLDNKKMKNLKPHYNDFKGVIKKVDDNYVTTGIFNILNTTKIQITELPVGTWTETYLSFLDSLIEKKEIKEYVDNSTEEDVNITVSISRELMESLNEESIIKKFKLDSKLSMNNMHLFKDAKIVKYSSVNEIIEEFSSKRLHYYDLRKSYLLNKYKQDDLKLSNIVKFITAVIKNEVLINNRKKDVIIKDLKKMKFDEIDNSYNYLLDMSLYNLTKEKVDELKMLSKNKKQQIKDLKSKTNADLWKDDLKDLKSLI